jgi:5'-methylthioadenosine/S-adenosylhomocysteine nucleosidase
MTVILGAMDGEISAFVATLTDQTDQNDGAFSHVTGKLDGHRVVVARCGVGKSLSAAVTQHLIDRYAPRRILVTGIAGALEPRLNVGDTLVATDCLQYDMDATALGFELGEVPYTRRRVFECSPELRAAAGAYRPAIGSVARGANPLRRPFHHRCRPSRVGFSPRNVTGRRRGDGRGERGADRSL